MHRAGVARRRWGLGAHPFEARRPHCRALSEISVRVRVETVQAALPAKKERLTHVVDWTHSRRRVHSHSAYRVYKGSASFILELACNRIAAAQLAAHI